MKEILTKRGLAIKVDDTDYEWLSKHKWHVIKKGYAKTSIEEKHYYMSRLILGVTDPKIEVDHKDGDKLNNQRYNLRPSTKSQNQTNRRHKSDYFTSKYYGVNKASKTRWAARVKINGKGHYIGIYKSELEAAIARDDFVKTLNNEFIPLNFSETE